MSSSSTTSPQSPQGRSVDRGWVRRVARLLDIPFCVAGGIGSVADAEEVLNAGAEKVSVNSPALQNPALIGDLSRRFGSQCVVVGIDSLRTTAGDRACSSAAMRGAARDAGRAVPDWVREVQARGAGEIVLNCMGVDGARGGFDVPQLKAMRAICQVPLGRLRGCGHRGALQRGVHSGRSGRSTRRQCVSLTRSSSKRQLHAAGVPVRFGAES